MATSSCAFERFFSQKKSIHYLIRNRLMHDKVAKLMFVHSSLSLTGDIDLREEGWIFRNRLLLRTWGVKVGAWA